MNASNNKKLSMVCIGVMLMLNVVRLMTGLGHKPAVSQSVTPDQLYQMTGHPVTAEQAEQDFDQKYAHGDLARMKQVQESIAANHSN